MGLKPYLWPTLAALFVCAASPALAQTVPAATTLQLPLSVGAGISGYNPDWGQGHLLGGTVWIDYTLSRVPSRLRGIGLEVEARDLNYGRSTTQPSNLREDAGEGGVIYSWPRYRNLRPYAKYLMGYGNVDYKESNLVRYHDSRTITIMGGGVDYRAFRSVWLRVDYEYQKWPDMFKATHPPGVLNPQGFTVGAMYHFGQSNNH